MKLNSTTEKIRAVAVDLTDRRQGYDDVYIAEWYTLNGLNQIQSELGWNFGWSATDDRTGKPEKIEVGFSATQLPDGTPYSVVYFKPNSEPEYL